MEECMGTLQFSVNFDVNLKPLQKISSVLKVQVIRSSSDSI